ncbi:MAG: hypothetical protein IJ689_03250 [Alphaproteobacteria bacterium]|nr:hypothetical protein [Alphaproteobacteria bacterium]
MNKYILMLGIAAVSIGSYAAMASNSATMNVTATIAHETNIRNISDINLGTITIDPSKSWGNVIEDNCAWGGIGEENGIKSISGNPCGYFTADFNTNQYLCGDVFSVTPESANWNNVHFYFGANNTDTSGRCKVTAEFSYDGRVPAQDTYNGSLTIEYNL